MKLVMLSAAVLSLTVSLSYGQGVQKLQRDAEDAFFSEDLEHALNLYEEVLRINPSDRLSKYRSVICSLLTKYKSEPVDRMIRAHASVKPKDKHFNYWLGRVYYGKHDFKKAAETWEKYLAGKAYKSPEIIEETRAFIESCNLAELHLNDSTDYEIEQITGAVNSVHAEYSPVYFRDKHELLFLSTRHSETLIDDEFQIYHSVWNGAKWNEPTVLDQFGIFTAENANIEVVNNDGRLFFYRDSELFYSESSEDNVWGPPIELDANIKVAKLESHFFINEHENRVLFASRKRSKAGDLDIYETFIDIETGKWTKPVHFDAQFNSEFDEDYPYLTPDHKTLYFSSKGHGSIGGYDVFRSEYNEVDNSWSPPTALKYPINSAGDDIQFKVDQEADAGYFVSNRLGSKGDFDVYFFHETTRVLVQGMVRSQRGKGIPNAQIELYPEKMINFSSKVFSDAEGNYQANVIDGEKVRVEISLNGELIHRDLLEMPDVGLTPVSVHKDFVVSMGVDDRPITVAEQIELVDEGSEFTEIRNIGTKFRRSNKALIKNIYFEFDNHRVNADASRALDELFKALNSNKKLNVLIAGHTDSVGPHDVNMRVSQRRANAIVQELINRGIARSRLSAKGFGETRPLASNDDEEDGRDLNRRIEVVILE